MTSSTLETTQLPDAFRDLAGHNVLFAHAHPDDEAVATASAMIALLAAGANVHGATATDGEASTRGVEVANSRGRLLELQDAYQEIGVPRVNQFYLGQPTCSARRLICRKVRPAPRMERIPWGP